MKKLNDTLVDYLNGDCTIENVNNVLDRLATAFGAEVVGKKYLEIRNGFVKSDKSGFAKIKFEKLEKSA